MPHPPGWVWPPTRDLATVAQAVANDWDLTLGARYAGARFSFSAPTNGGVLKVRPREDDESDHEPDALRFWNGDGAVRMLREDPERRAMLIERAMPGNDASDLPDGEVFRIAIEVGRRIWRPAGEPFRSAHAEVERWLAAVDGTGHRFVPIAREIFERIEGNESVLVHGDYHHHNLLRHGDDWVVIDPKPLLAEPEFDVVTLLWNPIGYQPTHQRTLERISRLASHGLDAARIRDWAIVRGTYLGLPLDPGEDERDNGHLRVVAALLDG